jgi:PPK2 family polyphosphate:nucleotide phosphotransferase
MPVSPPVPGYRHLVPFDGDFSVRDLSTKAPKDSPSKAELERELGALVGELDKLQQLLFADGRFAVLSVFQAMDAAGKDSTVRKVFSGVNPAGFRVNSFGRPSELELRHDFLWRCQQRLPERGKIGVFIRSHYEEVLVVRVHPEFLEAQRVPDGDLERIWEKRFESIREFEHHLARNGTVVVKFWLNVSREEQKKRFLDRIEQPEKNWKFRLGDLDDRDRWKDYMAAFDAMLRETSRKWAPWYAIPADDKGYMHVAVARVMVDTLKGLGLRFPEMDAGQRRELKEGRRRLMDE